jgi:hypothetical protein
MLPRLVLLASVLVSGDAYIIRHKPALSLRDDILINPDSLTVWDYGPDYYRDEVLPYPPLKNTDGSNITIDKIRGTRLFGWTGCGDKWSQMSDSWNEFHDIVKEEDIYKNMDWRGKPARDFWGGSSKEDGPQIHQTIRDAIQSQSERKIQP